jgi:hypothetical protein
MWQAHCLLDIGGKGERHATILDGSQNKKALRCTAVRHMQGQTKHAVKIRKQAKALYATVPDIRKTCVQCGVKQQHYDMHIFTRQHSRRTPDSSIAQHPWTRREAQVVDATKIIQPARASSCMACAANNIISTHTYVTMYKVKFKWHMVRCDEVAEQHSIHSKAKH